MNTVLKLKINLIRIWSLTTLVACLSFGCIAQTNRGATVKPRETASSENRIALVIGNSNYQFTGKLDNPVNDATDMAQSLKGLGFEVISGMNLTLPQMRKLVREFGAKLAQQKGIGLFYYAGHGIQAKGRNFLIPVDAEIASEVETEDVAVDVNFVLQQLDGAGNGFNIVILDACRNNPFARSWNRDIGSGGLAQLNAPTGTLIAYATAPGDVASDGAGRNGLYTSELLRQMQAPDLVLEEVFKNVRAEVRKKSNGRQVPWESSSVEGDFYFAGAAKPQNLQIPVPGPVPVQQIATTAPRDKAAVEREAWRLVQNSKDMIDYRSFLEEFPDGANAPSARAKLEPSFWREVEISDTPSMYISYLSLFPQGKYVQEAKNKLNEAKIKEQQIQEASQMAQVVGFLKQASKQDEQKNYDQVIELLTKAINLDSKNAEAYSSRGWAYKNKNDYDNALIDLTKAIELNPQNNNYYNRRGIVYQSKGNYEKAIENSTKAIELAFREPAQNKAVLYSNRAISYSHNKEYDKAIEDYTKAIEFDPQNTTYKNSREEAYKSKDNEKAINYSAQPGNNSSNTIIEKNSSEPETLKFWHAHPGITGGFAYGELVLKDKSLQYTEIQSSGFKAPAKDHDFIIQCSQLQSIDFKRRGDYDLILLTFEKGNKSDTYNLYSPEGASKSAESETIALRKIKSIKDLCNIK